MQDSPFADPAASIAAVRQAVQDENAPTPMPTHVRRLTVELTKYCEVGCSFCKYCAPYPKNGAKDPRLYLSTEAIDACLDFVARSGVNHIVLTGGGEPTHELPTVLRILSDAPVEVFSIYTAGQWATSDGEAESVLRMLADALRRPTSRGGPRLFIRVSVDTFHETRIGIEPVLRILAAFERHRDSLGSIEISLRTVIGYDQPIREIAARSNGYVEQSDIHKATLILGNGTKVDVLGMNLILAGRIDSRKAPFHSVRDLRTTLESLQSHLGPGWPLLFDGGLNVGIRPSGRVYLYGSTPEDLGRVPQAPLSKVIGRAASHPISVAIFEEGLLAFFDALALCDPDVAQSAEAHSDPPLLVPSVCAKPRGLLLAYLVALVLTADRSDGALATLKRLGLNTLACGDRAARVSELRRIYQEGYDVRI